MIEVRPMQKRDIDAVFEIEKLSFRSPWSKLSLQSELKNEVAHYYVLTREGKVAAFLGMWLLYDEAHVTNVAVHPMHRRAGLGRLLMLYSMRAALRLGATAMTLEVRETNVAAQTMYRGLDFSKQGYRPRYYSDTGEGALLLWNNDIAETVEKNACSFIRFGLELEG
ncbi:MAG: ribosomal protein S18-alanine N-acetyltransferase [Clostridia bacterium]|nr:ribosomal protein S18-alanine N-acetyltransferase [Clostridia bacterium]